MKPNYKYRGAILLWLMLFSLTFAMAQTTISGTVLDDDTKESIIGASVLVKGTSTGTVTDANGNFSLATNEKLPFTLVLSYTGYEPIAVVVRDANSPVNILLRSGSLLSEVVVSASRKPEKVQDAPASISIITAERIENQTVANPISLLENTVGVSIERQGVARTNISMRGGSDLLSTSTFVMMDYRSLIGAGLNSFDAGATALTNIDIARVEVIRGPASALYGPGVTAGVVHFLTKDPFDFPGTTIEVVGGNQSTLRTTLRHAAHNEDKTFGYKINALYSNSNAWPLDPDDPTDAATLATFQSNITDPLTGETIRTTDGNLDEKIIGYNTSASLYFRPNSDLNVVASGGLQGGEGLFWSSQGEGYTAATDIFGQVRLGYKNLFAQVYYNTNTVPDDPAEKGFLYRTGQLSTINRKQFETQLQYNFDVNSIKTNFTFGGDYRTAALDSETRTFGRNEEDDDYDIYGGYLQTKTNLTPKLDMVLAARYDGFSGIDQSAFSPRVAFVYKAAPNHTLRATYNKAFAPNSAFDLYADQAIGNFGAFDLWLNGNTNVQTFNDPSTTWLIPGLGETQGVGMDVGLGYGFITTVLAGQIAAGNPDLLPFADLLPILGSPDFVAAIAGAGVFSAGVPIDVDGNIMAIQGTPVSTLREDVTYELGYNGTINNRFGVSLDIYAVNRKNFTGLRQISPLVVLPTLGEDINSVLVPTLTGTLIAFGQDAATAQAIAQATAAAYLGITNSITYTNGAPGPLGLVETDQVPEGGLPHLAYGYRNFGDLTYYGLDLAVNYYATDEIRIFANYSGVSQTEFSGEDLGKDAAPTDRSNLNQSQHKIRLGGNYEPELGVQAGMSVMHNSEFESSLGVYAGTVEARTLVDVNVGYRFNNGLFASISVDNLLNNKYRTFPRMPEIGTRILGTVRYTFGTKK